MKQAPVNIKNKRATFDYELVDTYTRLNILQVCSVKKELREHPYKISLRRNADILFMSDALNLVLRMYCSSSLR